MKRLIITADDFGAAVPINEAVEEAHRRGVLSAASLMVGAPAVADAVDRARRLPSLGVGLHLTLVDGSPVLSPGQIPDLLGPDGRFSGDPIRFGLALFFSPGMRQQAEAEIKAQFERFRVTRLPLDHVNGHQHFHMHPVVARAIARIAPGFGSPPVRIPIEPFRPSWQATADRPLQRLASWLLYTMQTRGLRRHLRAVGIPLNDYVFGVNDSGAMVERRLLQFLERLPEGVTELYCHPATRRWDGPDNLPAHYRPEQELAALLSAEVRAKLDAIGVRPRSFRETFA
ncbi:MAG TPA: hopanoid biosynthesis-associated protein HpnK [Hyphomicrobiaceae bacterium]|nr:hopanoid biosynthesis-associated protein HpnK [Hyphomicrobiaceae bacterium]